MPGSAVLFLSLLFGLLLIPKAAAEEQRRGCSGRVPTVSIETIQRDYDRWAGRCVRMRGIHLRERLYASREATLEQMQLFGEGIERSIIVLSDGAVHRRRRPARVEVTGTIGSCAVANRVAAAEMLETDAIIIVSGYCHTSLATFVRPRQVRVLSSDPIPRLLEADVRPEERALIPFLGASGSVQDHVDAARALVAAIAAGDEREFIRLANPGVSAELDIAGGGEIVAGYRDRLRDARADFAAARRQGILAPLHPLGDRQQTVLIDREELDGLDREPARPERLVVCWCRIGNCQGLWPISRFDADNDRSRPYACVETSRYYLGRANLSAIAANGLFDDVGLAEPAPRP